MRLALLSILWLFLPSGAEAGEGALVRARSGLEAVVAPGPEAAANPLAERAAGRGLLTPRRVNGAKSAVATCAVVVLLWGAVRRRAGEPGTERRLRDGLLLSLGLLGGLCWWNLLQFHFPGYAHRSEIYHYYIGSKYFPELGYTRLYDCTAVADREAGVPAETLARRIRNLETNRLETAAAILADPTRCTRHFSPERWEAFKADVAWMRNRVPDRVWRQIHRDHGYNATPAWTILGKAFASTGPASERQIRALTLLDPALLLVMWSCVWWAFGWRATCVALIFWGTNYPAPFGWTGGAYLRQGWLAATVVGICLLRRNRPVGGGFLLASAALLRIFPGLILVGVALKALLHMARKGRPALSPAHRGIALGCLLAVATVMPLSALMSGGYRAWPGFVENSRVHLNTPLLNHMGLRTLLSYHPDSRYQLTLDSRLEDPAAKWKASRRANFAAREGLFWILVLGYLALLARAVDREEDWVATVLGIGMIPIAAELTGYYYGVLLAFGLLWVRREIIGAALCGLSALSWLIAEVWHWTDEILTWTSLAVVAFVVFATLATMARERPAELRSRG